MRRKSGLGPSGWKMTFENFEPCEGKKLALRSAKSFDPDSDTGLVFYGPTGVGKSHLGCAIVNRSIEGGIFARFLRTVNIPKENTEEVEKLSDPDDVPVLVLDDLGSEKGTDRALECLYSIIDGRAWNRVPIVITTNYKPEALKDRLNENKPGYGDRLISRLKKACKFVPVGGEDMRGGEKHVRSIRSGK